MVTYYVWTNKKAGNGYNWMGQRGFWFLGPEILQLGKKYFFEFSLQTSMSIKEAEAFQIKCYFGCPLPLKLRSELETLPSSSLHVKTDWLTLSPNYGNNLVCSHLCFAKQKCTTCGKVGLINCIDFIQYTSKNSVSC